MEAQYEAVRKEKQIELLQRKQQTRNTIIYSLLAGLLVLGVVGFLQYRNINIGKRIAEKEIIQLRQEKQLVATNSILKGQDEERSRVAKDLHDGLGGLLSGIKLTLNNMRGNTTLPEGGIQTFNRALEQLDSAIGEMRRIAHNMMPESLVRFGLVETLKDYCEDINQSGTMRASFQTYGLDKRLESSTETILYRILQEAINNVIKHAKATEMQVQLTRSGNQLSVCIEDNGIGLDINSPQYRRGSGARNIQQRVDYLNGKLDIRSVPGKGTSVFIEIPA
ncbi:sensor histidine kinase [Dyadobacter sp. CY312]|uniref:sensor histidine kinase n=1 Tax=Dyadobacter sp. CY312 TaxID=2907303 RepID=UPI001F1BAB42|nr:sensor histidine kinase [Dyadobacter sp. CY312]MCE7041913.1 sensor histidine kinase [Dyadobacter sp. CY312]